MIEHKPIVSILHFKKGCSGELVINSPVPHEPSVGDTQGTVGIGEADEALIRNERLGPDLKHGCSRKRGLQFEHGYLLGLGTDETLDPDWYRALALPSSNLNLFPILFREMHGLGNMRCGDDQLRRNEPTGAAYSKHARICVPLVLTEHPLDAHRGVNEL